MSSFMRELAGRPALIDWLAVGLAGIGAVFALVASIRGIRMKPPATAVFQGGADEVVEALRKISWVLLFASVAVFAGVGIQVVQLARRY